MESQENLKGVFFSGIGEGVVQWLVSVVFKDI